MKTKANSLQAVGNKLRHETDAARYWHVKDGLRSSELLMIQRGLNMYVQSWRDIKSRSETQQERDEAQGRIDAIGNLSDRLRPQNLDEMKLQPGWYSSPINLPEATSGKVSIKHVMVENETAIVGARQAYLRGIRPVKAVLKKPLRIHKLVEEGHGLWMTDLPEELNQIQEMLAAVNPKGHVLVGGLGLGLVASYLPNVSRVASITVVEKNKDVIKLIKPYLHPGIKVFQSDILTYIKKATMAEYDHYLLDTWCGTNEGTWWDDVLPLRRAIRSRWGSKPKIHCWAEDIMWGQVEQQLTRDVHAHWHYVKEVTNMTSRQAEAFLRDAGLPTWEATYGEAIDATYKK